MEIGLTSLTAVEYDRTERVLRFRGLDASKTPHAFSIPVDESMTAFLSVLKATLGDNAVAQLAQSVVFGATVAADSVAGARAADNLAQAREHLDAAADFLQQILLVANAAVGAREDELMPP